MVASNARKNFGFLHISFYKVVQIVLPIIHDYEKPINFVRETIENVRRKLQIECDESAFDL